MIKTYKNRGGGSLQATFHVLSTDYQDTSYQVELLSIDIIHAK